MHISLMSNDGWTVEFCSIPCKSCYLGEKNCNWTCWETNSVLFWFFFLRSISPSIKNDCSVSAYIWLSFSSLSSSELLWLIDLSRLWDRTHLRITGRGKDKIKNRRKNFIGQQIIYTAITWVIEMLSILNGDPVSVKSPLLPGIYMAKWVGLQTHTHQRNKQG